MLKISGIPAAVAAVMLSLTLMTAAQAKPCNEAAAAAYRTSHAVSMKTPEVKLVPAPQSMPTWPEASPAYHGSNGG